jgi:hypothetical protein
MSNQAEKPKNRVFKEQNQPLNMVFGNLRRNPSNM